MTFTSALRCTTIRLRSDTRPDLLNHISTLIPSEPLPPFKQPHYRWIDIIFTLRDERSLANKFSAAQKHDANESDNPNAITDSLEPARSHGNKPSRGAEIDAEIQREEEEMLRKKNE